MTTTYDTQADALVGANALSEQMLASSTVIGFDGQNCEYSDMGGGAWCDGWDGNDRRCECGNRRVGWTFLQLTPGKWHFYAEAY